MFTDSRFVLTENTRRLLAARTGGEFVVTVTEVIHDVGNFTPAAIELLA